MFVRLVSATLILVSASFAQDASVLTLHQLKILPEDVMTAGCSHAGDFAHQFHVAYSGLVNRGSCVFSGQPYHCAVTKFARDELVTQTDESSVPRCDGCLPGKTLIYDHCKNHPQFVDIGQLPDYVRRSCDDHNNQKDCIDDPDNLFTARVFAFQPTEDRCYIPPAVANVEALYGQLVTNPEKQIKYVEEYPFAHTLPTNDTSFWNESEPAGYDGPGECLRHVYDEQMWAGEFKERHIHVFDQTEFFVTDPPELASNGTGLNTRGVIYIPEECEEDQCRMLILASGCGGPHPSFGGESWSEDWSEGWSKGWGESWNEATATYHLNHIHMANNLQHVASLLSRC